MATKFFSNETSLWYFLTHQVSSGMIANKIPYSDYETIDKIRLTAIQILLRDGDRMYSLSSFSELIQEALLEFEENKMMLSNGRFNNNEMAKGGGVSEKKYSVYELYFGQPYNFYNEEQDKFIWSEANKATLYTKEEAEKKRSELLKPRMEYYQRTGKNYTELHIGDLFKKGILKKYANGGGVGFIPIDVEEKLALLAKWGGLTIREVIEYLNAMTDANITDADLQITPTKNTLFQRDKAVEKKIAEIWAKVEPKYKGELEGYSYYSMFKELILRNFIYEGLLKRFKPFRKNQKFAKGGEVENEMFDKEFYIEFLNKKKGFKKDKIYFRSYEEAIDWSRKNLESFSPDMIKVKMFEKSEGGKIQQVEMEIDLVYSRSGFLNKNGSWKEKLIELLQDASFEAYMIYQKLNPIQKEEVLQELYEMDNDMGSYGDEDIETTKENLSIMLTDAQNGKVYGRGGAVKYLKNISRKIQKTSLKTAKKGISTAIKKGKQAVDTTKGAVKEKIRKEKKGIAINVISETIKNKAKGREEASILQNASSIIKKRYKNGGRLKTYMSISNYRKMLEKLSDEKLLSYYVDEYGFDINESDHMLRIKNERNSVIDDLVYEYSKMMKSSGRL